MSTIEINRQISFERYGSTNIPHLKNFALSNLQKNANYICQFISKHTSEINFPSKLDIFVVKPIHNTKGI